MASKSKLKIFGRIGGHKKNKVLEVISAPSRSHIIDQIEISDDYCLPPDCDDDDLYSEPVDSLNSHLDVSPTRSVSSQHSNTASDHIEVNEVLNTQEHTAGFDNCSVNTSTSSSSSFNSRASPLISKVNRPLDNTKDIRIISGTPPTEVMINSALIQHMETSRLSDTPDANNKDGISTSPSSNSDALHGIYVNESQLRLEEIKKNRQNRPVSTISQPITPSEDPRNDLTGDEYDCPWDLKDTETEVYELVKQVKQKQSVSSSTSQQSQSPNSPQSAAAPKRSPTSSVSTTSQPAANMEKENNNKPRMSINKRLTSSGSMSSVVLVEGEWREAKNPLAPVLVSPSSPELSSPPTIISHSPSAVSHTSPSGSTNAASNVIYDHNSDSEIPARLRYSDEKQKAPFAQPRGSVSSLHSVKSQDSFYQNFHEAKMNPDQDKTDDFYDDPWNVERVQQDLMDKISLQQSRQNTTDRRSTAGDNVSTPRSHTSRHDAAQISGSSRNDRVSTSSLASEKARVDKLSPRAVSGSGLHKPGSAAAPPLPKNGPGQAHANKLASSKPVLVVQRTTALPSSQEHKLTTTGSRSSMRKNSASSDVPECQHRLGLGVNRNIPLTQQSWYHGSIQRNYAEELLRRQPDGSFLVRDTTGSLRDKTLSLKNSSGFIHIKIVQQPDGTYILGQFSHPFKSIMEMVEYYSRHKVNIKGAEHTYLEIPVMREL